MLNTRVNSATLAGAFTVFTSLFRAMARLGSSTTDWNCPCTSRTTLVIGPLPLQTRPVRVPVGIALAVCVAVLVATAAAATAGAPRLLGTAVAPVAARLGVVLPATPATPAPVNRPGPG